MKKRHLKNQPHLLRVKNEKPQKPKSKPKPPKPKIEKEPETENDENLVQVNKLFQNYSKILRYSNLARH